MAISRTHGGVALCVAGALIGIVLTLLTFYPGVLTVDSSIQLREARSHYFGDWHPPLMAAVWAVLDPVLPGAFGMLLLNSLVFWIGLALVVFLADLPPKGALAAILVIGLYPPIFSTLGVIWKDVNMGGAMLLGFGVLWWAQVHASRLALLPALACFVYASAMRHNAAPALLPMAWWAAWIWSETSSPQALRSPSRITALTLLLFVAVVGTASLTNYSLTRKHFYPTQLVMLHDLAAISLETGQVLLPATLRTTGGPVTLDSLRCSYSVDNGGLLNSGTHGACAQFINKILDAAILADLQAAWLHALVTYPQTYLAHRWRVFSNQIALGRDRVCYPLNDGRTGDSARFTFTGTALYGPVMTVHAIAAYSTPMFRGWLYLVLLAAQVGFLAWHRSSIPGLVLASSGLLFGLAYFFLSPACPFRYLWWSLLASLVVMVIWAGGRFAERAGIAAR